MIFYNKKLFEKAGVDPENPPLGTYDEFLATARKLVASKAAHAAIYPAPIGRVLPALVRLLPAVHRRRRRKQLIEDGKAQFTSPEGIAVANFWKTLYDEGLAPKEKYNGDSFADAKAAMAIVGPWAIAVYKDIDWGVAPPPDRRRQRAVTRSATRSRSACTARARTAARHGSS